MARTFGRYDTNNKSISRVIVLDDAEDSALASLLYQLRFGNLQLWTDSIAPNHRKSLLEMQNVIYGGGSRQQELRDYDDTFQ